MTELDFCEKHCGQLSGPQRMMTRHNITNGRFLGIARPIGQMHFCPMILMGKTVIVIDRAGYYQLAAVEGRLTYKREVPDHA